MQDVTSFRGTFYILRLIFLVPFNNIRLSKAGPGKKNTPLSVIQFIDIWPAMLQKEFLTALTKPNMSEATGTFMPWGPTFTWHVNSGRRVISSMWGWQENTSSPWFIVGWG